VNDRDPDPSHSPTLPASVHDTAVPDPDGTQPSAVRRGPTIVGGRYALSDQLGAGGMGVVWEADDRTLPRKVAVKILHATATDPDAAMRLRREAELLAEVQHPNVVAVLDVGVIEPDRPFVVMERLRGRSLSAWIADAGPLGWPQAVQLAIQICEGLARAHELGIIHRDLKSSNVFIVHDAHGRPTAKIIDFGLAKATAVTDRARVPTKSGIVFGTPAYMPPEQVRGEALDGRADVYALGVMIFEMTAGRRPWVYSTIVETLYAQLFEAPPPLRMHAPDAPPELEHIVQRCLAKQRDGRPPDVHSLRSELLGVGKRGGTALPVVLAPPSQPVVVNDMRLQARRSTAPWIGVGALVAAIAAGGVWWLQRPSPVPAEIDSPAPPAVAAPELPVAAPPPAELAPAPPTVIVMPQPLPAPIIAPDPAEGPPRDPTPRSKPRPAPPPVEPVPPPVETKADAKPDPKAPALGKSGTFEDPFANE
jgi:serine/threonine-protein kinase